MKHIRIFDSFDFTHDVYLLNNEPVKIVYLEYITSTELSLSYKTQDGSMYLFNDTIKDFEDAFTPVDSSEFVQDPIVKKVDPNATYNVTYTVNGRKISTLDYNKPSKLAYSLKGMYSKDPKYRLGKIKVELNS